MRKLQNMKLEKIVSVVVLGTTVITPLAALAQTTISNYTGYVSNSAPITSLTQAGTSFSSIVQWVINIFWILTVLFLIWAAILYLTAGGDEEKLKAAKSRVINAIIAGAIALLSTGLSAIVSQLLKSGA
jgi:threonine/homoserine/homoserine lactone efflux protein